MSQSALRLVGKEDGDKQRALEAALSQIDRAFGKGSVMKLGAKGKIVEIERISGVASKTSPMRRVTMTSTRRGMPDTALFNAGGPRAASV